VPADGGDGVVNAILHAHLHHEAVRQLRSALVHVLAVLGGALALTSAFPAFAPRSLSANLPLAWDLCCGAAVVTGLREASWLRQRSRLLARTERDANEGS
jgi:hypothetical protein